MLRGAGPAAVPAKAHANIMATACKQGWPEVVLHRKVDAQPPEWVQISDFLNVRYSDPDYEESRVELEAIKPARALLEAPLEHSQSQLQHLGSGGRRVPEKCREPVLVAPELHAVPPPVCQSKTPPYNSLGTTRRHQENRGCGPCAPRGLGGKPRSRNRTRSPP